MTGGTESNVTGHGGEGPTFRIARGFALLGGVVMLGSAALVSLDVFFRNLFGVIPFRSFELTTYAFAAATAFSLGYALLDRKHIRIDVVYRRFPARMRVAFDVANLVLMVGVAVSLAYHGARVAMNSWQIGASSQSGLGVPLVIPQGIWAAGLIWFAICAVALSLRVLRDLMARRVDLVSPLIGIDLEDTDEI